MRRGRSTGAPSREEAARIVAAKEGPCIACLILHERGDLPFSCVVVGCDYHHMKSGNVRRGHRHGVGLCLWHHRGQPWGQWTCKQLLDIYGPSLMDGSALFHRTYGEDDVLIARQDALLGIVDEAAA
ncbi:MAG: Ref family protein [Pseudomonadota bacterium]|nr:Ref family protein [Pseudomonadota bacterium]